MSEIVCDTPDTMNAFSSNVVFQTTSASGRREPAPEHFQMPNNPHFRYSEKNIL